MSKHTWFSYFKFLFNLCVWEGDTHRVQKRASDQISGTGVTYSCEPMWLLEANRFAGKGSNTLNLQASSLAPSELICNEIWNQLLWTMTVPLLNADTLLIQLNSFHFLSCLYCAALSSKPNSFHQYRFCGLLAFPQLNHSLKSYPYNSALKAAALRWELREVLENVG